MADEWKPGTVYLRRTDKKGGTSVQQHQCWNTELFITGESKRCIEQGVVLQIVTEKEYRKQNWRK